MSTTTQQRKIIIIIPSYNEAKSLPKLLQRINAFTNISVVLVDDGSCDTTAVIAKRFCALVLRNRRNMGSGRSIARGLQEAVKSDCDAVILMDADGQHDPKHIRSLVSEIRNGADYVIASRYVQKTPAATSPLRKMGTMIISFWLWLWFGKRIYDPTSGFRAMSSRALAFFADHYPTYFSEPETLLDVIDEGLVIQELPCVMRPRIYGRSSISFLKAVILMLYIMVLIPKRAIWRCFDNAWGCGRL